MPGRELSRALLCTAPSNAVLQPFPGALEEGTGGGDGMHCWLWLCAPGTAILPDSCQGQVKPWSIGIWDRPYFSPQLRATSKPRTRQEDLFSACPGGLKDSRDKVLTPTACMQGSAHPTVRLPVLLSACPGEHSPGPVPVHHTQDPAPCAHWAACPQSPCGGHGLAGTLKDGMGGHS